MLRRLAITMLLVFALTQAFSLGCAVHCAAMQHAATDGMAMSGCASSAGMGADMSSEMSMTQDASSERFAASMPPGSSTMPCAGPCSQQQEVVQARRRTLRVLADAESAVTLRPFLSAHLCTTCSSASPHRPPSLARLVIPLRI